MVACGDVVLQAGGWELFALAKDQQGRSVSHVTVVGSASDPKGMSRAGLCQDPHSAVRPY